MVFHYSMENQKRTCSVVVFVVTGSTFVIITHAICFVLGDCVIL